MKYKSNCNVVYSCKYHVVWCPKYRRPVLVEGVDVRLKSLIVETCSKMNVDIIEMEIMPDHVHLLIEVDPQFGIHRAVKQIKGVSLKSTKTGVFLAKIKNTYPVDKQLFCINSWWSTISSNKEIH